MKKTSFTFFSVVEKKSRTMLKLKITFLLMVGMVHVSTISRSQSTNLTSKIEQPHLSGVLQKIESTIDIKFSPKKEQVDVENSINRIVDNKTNEENTNQINPDEQNEQTLHANNVDLSEAKRIHNEQIQSNTQSQPITGTVTDEEGEPIPGVTVSVKGTPIGTSTDVEGKYSLSGVPPDSMLVFSYIGMKTLEVPVDDRNVIDITMQWDALGLDEVVVVGYGIQRKESLTGAVSQISGD